MAHAVLVIDIQKEFFGDAALFDVPRSRELVDSIPSFVDEARRSGAPIVFTAFRLPMPAPIGRRTESLGVPGLHRSPIADLVDSLGVQPTDLVIDKPRQGAFTGTALDLHLRRLDVTAVTIVGATTHACCLATAMDAAALDYDVTVVSDLTTSPQIVEDGKIVMTADEVHLAALRFIGYGLGQILESREALDNIRRDNRG